MMAISETLWGQIIQAVVTIVTVLSGVVVALRRNRKHIARDTDKTVENHTNNQTKEIERKLQERSSGPIAAIVTPLAPPIFKEPEVGGIL